MPTEKLTEKSIARIKAPHPSGRDTLYWDLELKGFAVRCSGRTNVRMFIVQRDIGGKSRRFNVGAVNGGITLEAARSEAADLLHSMRKGNDPKKRVVVATLQSALESYLLARKDLRPGSIRMYRQIERTLKPWLNLPLHEITEDMVEKRHRELVAIVGRHPRYSGRSSANFALKTLGIIYGFAAKRNPELLPNPVQRLERQWYPVPRRTRHVTTEQLPEFYQAVMNLENHIARDYIRLLLFTGMRRDEILKLKWTEVDFTEKMLRLSAQRTKAKREFHLPMSDVVHGILVERRALGNAGFVFPGNGTAGHLTANIKSWKMIEATTGIKVSAHDMRRSFSSIAGETEMSPFALKAMLNHSGGDVTSGYVIISSTALRAAVQKVTDRLKALCELPALPANVARMKG